jgi:hypothetical protein
MYQKTTEKVVSVIVIVAAVILTLAYVLAQH